MVGGGGGGVGVGLMKRRGSASLTRSESQSAFPFLPHSELIKRHVEIRKEADLTVQVTQIK